VDTQGLVLEATVHSAKVVDREGIKLLLDPSSSDRLPRLSHLWLDAGYTGEGKGADWVQEEVVGWTAEIVRHPPKLVPEEVGEGVDRRGAADRSGEAASRAEGSKAVLAEEVDSGADLLLALSEQEAELRDYERLPETAETLIYVAMSRLMVRRLARS
jgi:putative transposase